MSYLQLINFLLLLALLSSSYGYKIQKNDNLLQRRSRDTVLKGDAQNLINRVFSNEQQTSDQIKKAIQSDRDNVDEISQNILEAVKSMANAGATDITNAAQWTNIQSELRRAINLIIGAYQRFGTLHQSVCNQISNYAQSMITKYGTELSALNQMSAPLSTTDLSNAQWTQFTSKYGSMLNYARTHEQTLRTAADCTADLMTRTLVQQTTILNPPTTSTVVVQISPPTAMTFDAHTVTLPCNTITADNGNRICSNGLADTTLSYANNVCACVAASQNYA